VRAANVTPATGVGQPGADASPGGAGAGLKSGARRSKREEAPRTQGVLGASWGEIRVSRALRNHNLWLAVGYVGILLLMARTYA